MLLVSEQLEEEVPVLPMGEDLGLVWEQEVGDYFEQEVLAQLVVEALDLIVPYSGEEEVLFLLEELEDQEGSLVQEEEDYLLVVVEGQADSLVQEVEL